MKDHRKNPAAVALGRRGGKARTPAKLAASRAAMAKINAKRAAQKK